MYMKTALALVLALTASSLQAKPPSIRRKSSQDIISMIAQGQMKTFEGELFKNNLNETALADWQNNVVTPLISYARANTTNASQLSALKQLDETLAFITFTIEFLHREYPKIAGIKQHIEVIQNELSKMLSIHNKAFDELTQNLHREKQASWKESAPKLITHVLTSDQHAFFDKYRKASQDGQRELAPLALETILKESGITATGNKFRDKPTILALLENLERYAYLLTDHYKRLVTHRKEKIATAQTAILQLRNTYGNTLEEDRTITESTDKPLVMIYRLSGTYAEVLQHLIRELRALL